MSEPEHDLRYAHRLREEASNIRELALGALNAGDVDEYDRLCGREARLVRASGWAAVDQSVAKKVMVDHGVELRSREAGTLPSIRCVPENEQQGDGDVEESGEER